MTHPEPAPGARPGTYEDETQPVHGNDPGKKWATICGLTVADGTLTNGTIVTIDPAAVTCGACRELADAVFVANLDPRRARPIEHVVITTVDADGSLTGHNVAGTAFGMGTLDHDVATGEVSITFVNVQALEVLYKDNVNRGRSDG